MMQAFINPYARKFPKKSMEEAQEGKENTDLACESGRLTIAMKTLLLLHSDRMLVIQQY